MAGSDDFTGQNIQDTYQRVLQLSSSGAVADGTGSLVPLLRVTSSYAVSSSVEILKELSSSYAETASFANSFEVTGPLTASNISASGRVTTSDITLFNTNAGNQEIAWFGGTNQDVEKIYWDGNNINITIQDEDILQTHVGGVNVKGTLSASTAVNTEKIITTNSNNNIEINPAGTGEIDLVTGKVNIKTSGPLVLPKLNLYNNAGTYSQSISWTPSSNKLISIPDEAGSFVIESPGNVISTTAISASGIVSSSGLRLPNGGAITWGGVGYALSVTNNNLQLGSGANVDVEGYLSVGGAITSSAVSSSGLIEANNILSSGRLYFGEFGGSNKFFGISGTGLALENTSYLKTPSITASGDISTSADLKGGNLYLGHSSRTIANTGHSSIGNLNVNASRILYLQHAEGYNCAIGGYEAQETLIVEGQNAQQSVTITANKGLTVNGAITSSGNISSSGNIITENAQIATNLSVGGFITSNIDNTFGNIFSVATTNLTASSNISASGNVYAHSAFLPNGASIQFADETANEVRLRGVQGALAIMSGSNTGISINPGVGHITASGHISSSANIYGQGYYLNDVSILTENSNIVYIGDTAAGSDFDRVEVLHPLRTHHPITASAVISQSDIGHATNILGGDLLVYGKIKSVGSELTIMSGSITASANISTSAAVQALTGSFGTNTTTITDRIETTGFISTTTGLQAPGLTASHKLLQLGSAVDTRQELVVYGKIEQKGSGLTIMSGSITASSDISMSGDSSIITRTGSFNHIITDGNTIEFRNAGTGAKEGSLKFDSTNGLQVKDENDAEGKLKSKFITATETLISTGNAEFTGPLTASGDISASGTIRTSGNILSSGAITANSIAAPGFTASHRLLQLGSEVDTKQELIVYGKIQQKGSGLTIMSGSITASADISMSGPGRQIITETGSFNHIITDGDTIEFRNKGTGAKMGSLKFDTSNGLQVKAADDSSGKTKIGVLDVDDQFVVSGDQARFDAPVTASIISCSTEATMGAMSVRGALESFNTIESSKFITSQQGLRAPGFTASAKLLQLGAADNERQELIVFGKLQIKGSDITMMSGSITASSDISTSAGVVALSGSFGTGTTTITDRIQTSGDIQSSGEITGTVVNGTKGVFSDDMVVANRIQTNLEFRAPGFTASNKLLQLGAPDNERQELIIHGIIRQKGSELTIMSGSITASGDISSSATIAGLTGSFGTGTTTITDYIHTTGTVSGSGILTSGNVTALGGIATDGEVEAVTVSAGSGGVSSKGTITTQGLINAGTGLRAPGFTASHKLLQIGSAVDTKQELIVHGKLQVRGSDFTIMSGSITASGDISASGNVMAGGGGTGSFDHIITSQNTIEFRNPGTKSPVGFVSFDATNGMQPMDASRANLPRLADKFATARTIDGVSFDGSANITTNQYMGTTQFQKVLMNEFNYQTNDYVSLLIGPKFIYLTNLNEEKATTIYATVQIPIGRTLTAVAPFGSTAPANSVAKNYVTLRGINIDGTYNSDPITFIRKLKTVVPELTLLGMEYPVDATTAKKPKHESTRNNYLMIGVVLQPGANFRGLVLTYS